MASYRQINEDVSRSNLNILDSNLNIKEQKMDAAFINSKGFSGNIPEKTIEMLTKDMVSYIEIVSKSSN